MKKKPLSCCSKRKWFKVTSCFFLLIFLLSSLVITIPSLVSTQWGKEKLLDFLNERIPGKIEVDSLSLSWFAPQKIEGMRLHDPNAQEILRIESFLTSTSLFELFFKTDFMQHKSQLVGLNAQIRDEGNGITNFQKSLSFHSDSVGSPSPFEIQIRDVNGLIAPANEGFLFELNGMTHKNGIEGHFSVGAQLEGFNLKQLFQTKAPLSGQQAEAFHLSAKIQHFPVMILDQLASLFNPQLQGVLLSTLGDQIYVEIDQHLRNEQTALNISASSPSLSVALKGTFDEGIFRLTNAGKIEFLLTPLMAQLGMTPHLEFEQPVQAKVTVDVLDIPYPFDLQKFTLQSSIQAHNAPIKLVSMGKRLFIEAANGQLHYSPSNEQANLNFNILAKGLEEYLGASAEFKGQLQSVGRKEIVGSFSVTSPRLNIPVVQIAIAKQGSKLTAPHLKYQLQKKLALSTNFLMVKDLQIAFDGWEQISQWKDFSTLASQGILSFDELSIQNRSNELWATIQNAHLPWSVSGLNNHVELNITAKTQLVKQNIEGVLKGSIGLSNWFNDQSLNLTNADIDGQMQMNDVPVAFLETWLEPLDVETLFGPTLDLTLAARGSLNTQNDSLGSMNLRIHAKEIDGNISLDLGKTLSLLRPASLRLKFTPEAFEMLSTHLIEKPELELIENAYLSLNIRNFSISRKDFNWKKATLDVDVLVDAIHMKDAFSNEAWVWKNLQGSVSTHDLGRQISFKLESRADQKGKIDLLGQAEDFWTDKGLLNFNGMTLMLRGEARHFPASAISRLVTKDPSIPKKIEALFGSMINTTFQAQLRRMNGPIQLGVKGPNGEVSLDGMVKESTLTLNKNLKAHFQLSSQLGQFIPGGAIPFLSEVLSSNKPMSIDIDSKDFSVKMNPFSISGIESAKGSVDIGKVVFSGEGKLAAAVRLINLSLGNAIPIQFTPIYFNMKKGGLTLSRFDFLLMDQYPFAMWGKVNFPKDKISLVLGIGGKTIAEAYNLKNFPPETLIQVPLKGSFNDASLDLRKATAKITAIAAEQQGPHGVLLGTILNLTSGTWKEHSKSPSPSTTPLPWQHLYGSENDKKRTLVESAVLDPISEAGKGTVDFLKKVFD